MRKKYVIGKKLITPNTFYVQAYYQKEMPGNKIETLIPADQTYYKTSRGDLVLYLHKDDYLIIYRDALYNVIKTIKVRVN